MMNYPRMLARRSKPKESQGCKRCAVPVAAKGFPLLWGCRDTKICARFCTFSLAGRSLFSLVSPEADRTPHLMLKAIFCIFLLAEAI
jgi:hypothetical protein